MVAKISGLVDETAGSVAAEQIDEIEAATYDWNADSGEGQGVCRIADTACVLLAVWEESESHVRPGEGLA